MKLGVTLPTFSADAQAVLEAACAAENAGLHGVFCFDHQWPLGQPGRPSLSAYPMLGAVAAATSRIRVGSLVARIGLLPAAVVISSIEGLHAILGHRLVAGLGTGDHKSRPEHDRYGLPYLGLLARLSDLEEVLARLHSSGIECWVGAGGERTNRLATGQGATLNFWGVSPEEVSQARDETGRPVTWGGPTPTSAEEASLLLQALKMAGASWVIWGWPSSIELVTEAAGMAGIHLGDETPNDPPALD
ncbi:MAG: LLM class flavin-dependent oxidoreductase [Acidimicrobiales bacterium]